MANTNWNHYKTFVAVYETKNLHAASDALGITRSAISQNLKELGNQIGAPLFNAHSKGVTPTDTATEIYPLIKSAHDAITSAERAVDDKSGNATVRMAVSDSSAELVIKQFFKTFMVAHPDIRLEIIKHNHTDKLKTDVDFIIDLDHYIDPTVYKKIRLFMVTSTFVATKEYIKAHNLDRPLTRAELFKMPIISRRAAWEDFRDRAHVTDTPAIIQSASTDMTYSMTVDGLGVGYFCREVVDIMKNPSLANLEITDLDAFRVYFACGFTRPLSRNAKTFIDELIIFTKPLA